METMTVTESVLTLIDVDPAELAKHPANLRKPSKADKAADAELVASIAAVGVLEPLLVVPDGTGYRIIAGHRRARAAVAAKRKLVPCVVRPDLIESAGVVAMLVENVQRRDLTAAEEAQGYAQLAAFGLSANEIEAATGSPADHVTRHLVVADSPDAVKAAVRHNLTLEEALAIAEFDDDPDAVAKLTKVADKDPGQFEHTASRLRQQRRDRQATEAKAAELTAAGVAIVAQRPGWDTRIDEPSLLDNLMDPAGKKLTPAAHKSCPGHAASIATDWQGKVGVVYLCTAPKEHGHRKYRFPGTNGNDVSTPEAVEAKSAERRDLLANNKAWRAAQPVRRRFVRELLARKTVPAGTLRFVTGEALGETYRWAQASDEVVRDLLGHEGFAQSPALLTALAASLPDNRLPMALLARTAAAAETAMDVHTWRNAVQAKHDTDTQERRYLKFLAACGYTLSPVEKLVTVPKPAKKAPAKRKPAKRTAKKAP